MPNLENGTAIQTHFYQKIGNVYTLAPICFCYRSEPDTAGTIFCPVHGNMWKRNGVVVSMNQWRDSENRI